MVKRIRVEEDEDEEQYHVEVINKARVDESGDWEYLVKWWGYDSDANSWEPEVNLAGCDRLLRSFWRHIGWDNKDYEAGDECVPSEEWIEKEKQFFRENFGRPPKVVHKKKKKKRAEMKALKAPIGKALMKSKNAKGKAVMKKPIIEDSDSSYEETDEESASSTGSDSSIPLMERAGPSNRGQKRAAASATDSDDSDIPLRKVPRKQSLSVPKINKGKEPVRPRHSTPAPSEQTDLHSLFSAPPTPEVSDRTVSHTALQASSSIHVATSSASTKPSMAQSLAPPKPPGPSHRNREPKVKALPLPLNTNTGNFTDTKRKIVERTGTIQQSSSAASVPLPTPTFRRGGFAGLSFKKKADAPQQSPTTSAPSADPRQNAKRPSVSDLQTSSIAASSGAWGSAPSPTTATGGWGSAPSPTSATEHGPGPSTTTTTGQWGGASPTTVTGGWGNTASSSTAAGGWGNTASSPGGWGNTASSSTASGGWGTTASSSNSTGGWGTTAATTSTVVRGTERANPQRAAPAPTGPLGQTMNKRPTQPQPSLSEKQRNDAEQFLASIMPDELAAPMNEPTGDTIEVDMATPPPRVPIIKMPKLPQDTIQSWEWSGELYMETGPKGSSPAAKLCKVHLSEPTTPRPTGLRLSICYSPTLPALRLEKFHAVSDIHLLLRACAPVQQFCKVSHKGEGDESVLKNLAAYMARLRQFTYARALMDDEQVGLLLVFTPSSTEVCNTLKLPSRFCTSPIIAALVPWKLNVKQYQENEWQHAQDVLKPTDGRIEAKLAESIKGLSKAVTAKPQYARGLRIHQFTTAEYEFFKRTPRKYCIWNMPSDGTTKEPGFETKALVSVLKAWKAEDVGYKTDVRVVFVHVGALRSLQKLQALAMRRAKRPDMRFYTYGTHHSVHPARWGIKEIFPLGGVVTFTAKAILEDPFEIYHLIEQISQHPLWMCYVHPCAVAAVAKTSYPATDVLSLLNRHDFFYARLLELVEEGKVSLLHVPPKSRSPRLAENDTSRTVDPGLDWASWALGISSMDSAGILQECLRIFDKRHPNISDRDVRTVIEQEVLSDIVQIQLEPAIMDNYRRFVMIVETRNDQNLETSGVELAQASKFDFKDDYFTAAERGAHR